MNRTGLLAAVAVMLASSPSFAQFGGMGGMGGGMGGVGGGMGGVGAQGPMAQGGRAARAFGTEVQRSAKVEMEGGQFLSGKIDLRPVIVDSDLGQYAISPDKIKMIRFLKPVNEAKPGNEVDDADGGEEEAAVVPAAPRNQAARRRAALAGGGMMGAMVGGMMNAGGGLGTVSDPRSQTGTAVLTRGKVVTTTDKEIIGMIHIPGDFRLELDFGALILTPVKLRSIMFTDDNLTDIRARAEWMALNTNKDAARPAAGQEATPPRYFRQGSFVIVISPVGDRVTLFNLETKKSESLELSGSKDGPLEVTPIVVENLVALSLKGPKVTRIAVADTASGTWHSQDLRKPIDGHAVPIVAPGVVFYKFGQEVYAYGGEAQRWDVAQLPGGVQAVPSVGSRTVTIENHGHIFTFAGKTGKWDHVDVRALLDGAGAEKK